MGAARRAALLMGAMCGVGQAFVAPGTPSLRASAPLGAVAGGVAPSVERSQQSTSGAAAASGVAAAALMAAAMWRAQQRSAKAPGRSPAVVVDAKPRTDAFAGVTVTPVMQSTLAGETRQGSGLVIRQSLKSCYKLYFHRVIPYKDRAKKNIRNRAYNIYHKNQYKRDMRAALKKVKEIQYGDAQPKSMDEAMTELKPALDTACLSIDEVCIQGILHRNTAARRKDRMCRAVLRGCVDMGLVEKPKDPFVPAFETIGYSMPKSYKTREPRPWQLPGWKSPWMLKKEFEKWKKQRVAAVSGDDE